MTLVLRADPYAPEPLADGAEDVRRMVESVMSSVNVPSDEAAQKDFWAMAGRKYGEFVREVNDAMEKRDAELTALHNQYHHAVADLERLTQQKLHQAEQEHHALSSTIRHRLVTTLTKRRQHLLRDKDQLDVADSNALLLHPAHFSLNNPSSPGGGNGANGGPGAYNNHRKTRHLRHHRAASPNTGGGEDKRKRKAPAAFDDEGNESPVPAYRSFPHHTEAWGGGGRSPFKEARDRTSYTQYESPAYSLERIFTDKELAMATATAQQATYRYFHQPQQAVQQADPQTSLNGVAADGDTGDVLTDGPPPDGEDGGPAITSTETPPPAAAPVDMERTATSSSHQVLTRGSAARTNPLAALSELASAAAGEASTGGEDAFAPVVPHYHAISRAEKSGAPAPPGVGPGDVESDFDMMRRTVASDGAEGSGGGQMRRQLLDRALGVSSVGPPYRLPLLETGPGAVVGPRVERPGFTGFAMPATYEAQRAKQTISNFGQGEGGLRVVGGGGETMSRTTSAGGSEGWGGGGPGGDEAGGSIGSFGGGVGGRGRGRGRGRRGG